MVISVSFLKAQQEIHHFGFLYTLWSQRGRLSVQYSMSLQVF